MRADSSPVVSIVSSCTRQNRVSRLECCRCGPCMLAPSSCTLYFHVITRYTYTYKCTFGVCTTPSFTLSLGCISVVVSASHVRLESLILLLCSIVIIESLLAVPLKTGCSPGRTGCRKQLDVVATLTWRSLRRRGTSVTRMYATFVGGNRVKHHVAPSQQST